jgi:Concanavalin A-like lectin/glucanases superfamily
MGSTSGNNVNVIGQGNWFTVYAEGSSLRFGPVNSTTPVESSDDPSFLLASLLNSWHHVAAVLQKTSATSSASRLYIDGTLAGTETFSTLQSSTGSCHFHFGSPAQSGNYCSSTTSDDTQNNFNGSFDNVRVFRRALSASEVVALYKELPPQ